LVFTEAQEVTKLSQEMKEENEKLKSFFVKISAKNENLKKPIEKTEETLTEIMRMLKESLKVSS